MTSAGDASAFFRPIAACASLDSRIDFAARGKMPPPFEILDLS